MRAGRRCTSCATASVRPPRSAKSVADPDRGRRLARQALATLLGVAGAAHFVVPGPFVAHLPPEVPLRLVLVQATGGLELLLAAALLGLPDRRRRVGLAAAVYLTAVFPANVYAAIAAVPVYPEAWMAWARLPLQPVLVAWAIWATR